MNITIAGYGFVGKAMEAYLNETRATVRIVDPKLSKTNVNGTLPHGVVICVDTPEDTEDLNQYKACDISNVIDVINITPKDIPILIKSTISIEGWETINQMFPLHRISFSPEFLRAETAIEDILATEVIYLGGGDVYFWEKVLARKVVDASSFRRKQVIIKVALPRDLILAKYFRNSFLATKVAFFNQVYDLCEAVGSDYDAFASLITDDNRIGDSHTRVTSERGFGGHCFPKDTSAIIRTANNYGVCLNIISQATHYNKQIRKGNT